MLDEAEDLANDATGSIFTRDGGRGGGTNEDENKSLKQLNLRLNAAAADDDTDGVVAAIAEGQRS